MAAILAAALVTGIHLASVHSEPTYPCGQTECAYNNTNPGVYLVMPSGLTVGAYHNSYRQVSAYAGWTWQTADGRFGLTAGAAVGYRHAPLMPMLTPSVRFDLSDRWAIRLSAIPKPQWPPEAAVLHLSLEYRPK
jgi:hypothetical protein